MAKPGPLGRVLRGAVGVAAPGFAVPRSRLERAVRRLREWGADVVLGRHVLDRDGYFAGPDAARAEDLDRFFRDPDLGAVWLARGGYGSARLLPRLDWEALRRNPKPLIGYSDGTPLLLAAADRAGVPAIHGPVVVDLAEPRGVHRKSLLACLEGTPYTWSVPPTKVLRSGRAAGRLMGGNLTVLVHLLGTPHQPDFRDAVVFLEEAGEAVYRLDRMLYHLKAAGVLEGARAVLVGEVAAPRRRRFPPDRRVVEVFQEHLGSLGVPVVTGLPFGHRRRQQSLPVGGRAEVDTRAGRIRLAPVGVA